MLWFSFFFAFLIIVWVGLCFLHMAHPANCLQFIPCPNGAQLPRTYHFILMPHLHNSTTVDRLHGTGFLTLRIRILIWSPADTKGPKSHLRRMLFFKDVLYTDSDLCVRESVCAYECKLSHACFTCMSVWVLRREAIHVHVVADGKVDVNFARAGSPRAFLYFFSKQNLCVEVMGKKNIYADLFLLFCCWWGTIVSLNIHILMLLWLTCILWYRPYKCILYTLDS